MKRIRSVGMELDESVTLVEEISVTSSERVGVVTEGGSASVSQSSVTTITTSIPDNAYIHENYNHIELIYETEAIAYETQTFAAVETVALYDFTTYSPELRAIATEEFKGSNFLKGCKW